jgi:hypothetical protein
MEETIPVFKQNEVYHFSDSQKHFIIKEFLSLRITKQMLWEKYTGRKEEKGAIVKWMRCLGYDMSKCQRQPLTFAERMAMAKTAINKITGDTDPEIKELKEKIKQLQQQLKEAELKALAYSTMIELAEEKFKIPIKKKYNTKP